MRFLFLFFSFLVGFNALAQDEDFNFSLYSPYHTTYSHLYYLQDDHYEPEMAAKTVQADDPKRAKKVAIKIKQVLDARGFLVDLESLPRDPNYLDSATRENKYVLFRDLPRIYLRKVDSVWLFSQTTVKSIDEIHASTFPFGADKLVSMLPKFAQNKIFGIAIWQYIGIFLLVFLTFIFYKIVSWSTNLLIHRGIKRIITFNLEDEKYVHAISRSISLVISLGFVNIFIPILQLPVKVSHYFIIGLKIVIPIFTMMIFYRAVDILGVYLERMAERTESTLDDQIVPLVRKALKTFVVIIGILFILQNLNFNITALLAGLSIGGLALALAAQDTIKHIFGSLMIFIDRPFQVGDWIVANDIDGTVEEVGFRSTRIRNFSNSVTSVPNGKLADMTVDNMGLRRYRRFSTNIAITYDTPPDLIESFVEGIKKIIEEHPDTRKDFYIVRFTEMKEFYLNVMLYHFYDVPDWQEEMRCRQEILLAIVRLARDLGIRFAFPTQTLHVEDFPGQEAKTPEYKGDREEYDKQVAAYFSRQRKN